jgi:hypothetical protein
MSLKRSNILAILLLVLGFTQFFGGWFGIKPLKGFGASLAMAPYTKVFSDVDGLETFASEFRIYTKNGDYWNWITITPEIYGKLTGSYNRRNVYGAAISYGPKLPEDLRRQIFTYALKTPGNLRKEINIPEGQSHVVFIRTKTKNRTDVWHLASTKDEEKDFGEFINQ